MYITVYVKIVAEISASDLIVNKYSIAQPERMRFHVFNTLDIHNKPF